MATRGFSKLLVLLATFQQAFTRIDETGQNWGSVIIRNNCPERITVVSVGSHYISEKAKDDEKHVIEPNANYTEPYRIVCPNTVRNCVDEDKEPGEGISMKISSEKLAGNVTQFEYSLVQEPTRHDTFQRMNYDISLLDCASTDLEGGIGDFNATDEKYQEKINGCPGYNMGMSLTFDNDTESANCMPLYCNGQTKCNSIYNYDRTRAGEMSLACANEYFGNMILDLCVGKNQPVAAAASSRWDKWLATQPPAMKEALQAFTASTGVPPASPGAISVISPAPALPASAPPASAPPASAPPASAPPLPVSGLASSQAPSATAIASQGLASPPGASPAGQTLSNPNRIVAPTSSIPTTLVTIASPNNVAPECSTTTTTMTMTITVDPSANSPSPSSVAAPPPPATATASGVTGSVSAEPEGDSSDPQNDLVSSAPSGPAPAAATTVLTSRVTVVQSVFVTVPPSAGA